MIIAFLTSAAMKEFGKRLFLLLASEYVKDTKTKLDDKGLKILEESIK